MSIELLILSTMTHKISFIGCLKYKLKLCKYLGISLKRFNQAIDNIVNKKIFKYAKKNYIKKIKLRPEMFQNI